jgi:hypothetical protein
MKKVILLPISLLILLVGLNVALAIGLGLTYHNLTKEKPILTLEFEKVPNQKQLYIAKISVEDKEDSNRTKIEKMEYKIYGDQWRVDALFVKMKYFANIFGIESKYALDRLEGRYKNINDENSKKHFAHKLEDHKLVDFMSPFVDTTYGSSVYKDIEEGVKYKVFKTPTGLMVREEGRKDLVKEGKDLLKKGEEYLDKGSKYIKDVGSKIKGLFN